MRASLTPIRNGLVLACLLVGAYIVIADVVIYIQFANNLCGNGCGTDSLVMGLLGTLIAAGLVGTIIVSKRKKHPLWATVERVTAYCWLLGPPMLLLAIVLSGPF